jgi:glycosyltransferase involved in cell wall biosynthesis
LAGEVDTPALAQAIDVCEIALSAHMKPLNLFYEEPEPDRWFPGDRFPRRWLRRLVRGRPQPGGHARVFLNLCAGLDELGIPYRVNDYSHLGRHPRELACVIGKPQVLAQIPRGTPILFGAAVYAHPMDDPDLLSRLNVRGVLVPCEWMRAMFAPAWGDKVMTWPVGIDTERWAPAAGGAKDIDLLIYNKIRWRKDELVPPFLAAIQALADRYRLRTDQVVYGDYREETLEDKVVRSRAMIFLCEHETQGLALLQTLSCDVPVIAWDRGGDWQDPAYYPDKVRFGPVTSVPYWSEQCGRRFDGLESLAGEFATFWNDVERGAYAPRRYVLDRLTLARCAREYADIAERVGPEI